VLRLHGVPWDSKVCREAACVGNLGLLQWLHSNVLINASRGGSAPMLEWLKSVTKPWSKGTMTEVAESQWRRVAYFVC
jgi:hypothetical protein